MIRHVAVLAFALALACSESGPKPGNASIAGSDTGGASNGGTATTGGKPSGTAGSQTAAGTASGGSAGAAGSASGDTLSAAHPGDTGLAADPAVLFFDDFEAGWGEWDAPDADTEYLHL